MSFVQCSGTQHQAWHLGPARSEYGRRMRVGGTEVGGKDSEGAGGRQGLGGL